MKSFGVLLVLVGMFVNAGCQPELPPVPPAAKMVELNGDLTLLMGVSQRLTYTKSNQDNAVDWLIEGDLQHSITVNEVAGYIDILVPWQPMTSNDLTLVAEALGVNQQSQRLEWRLAVERQDYVLFLAELSRLGERELYLSGTEKPNPIRLNDRLNNGAELSHVLSSPAGGAISYVRNEAGSKDALLIVDLSTLARKAVTLELAASGSVVDVVWAKTGQYISAIVDETGNDDRVLYVIDALSGAVNARLENISNDVMAWNAAGTLLAYRNDNDELFLYDTVADESLFIEMPEREHGESIQASLATWHPRDDMLALVANIGEASSEDIVVYDHAAEAATVWVVNDGSQCSASRGGTIKSITWAPEGKRLAFTGELRAALRVELFSIDLTQPLSHACQLVNSTTNTRSIVDYQWSPSGARLGYAIAGAGAQMDIYSSEYSGQNNRQYTTATNNQVHHWSWFTAGSEERLLFVHYNPVARQAYVFVVMNPSINQASPLNDLTGDQVVLAGKNVGGIDTILPLVWSNDKTRFMIRGYDSVSLASNVFMFDLTTRQLEQWTSLTDQSVAADYQWLGSNTAAIYRVESSLNEGIGIYVQSLASARQPVVTSIDLAPGGQVFELIPY